MERDEVEKRGEHLRSKQCFQARRSNWQVRVRTWVEAWSGGGRLRVCFCGDVHGLLRRGTYSRNKMGGMELVRGQPTGFQAPSKVLDHGGMYPQGQLMVSRIRKKKLRR